MKNRIEWLDFLKGITICLVIFGHCITRLGKSTYIDWINILIYSFHMPMFFVLSGYTLNVKYHFNVFLVKKFLSLIVPAALFSILLIFYYIIIHILHHDLAEYITIIFDFSKIINTILFTKKTLTSGYWFLPVLFSTEIISFFLIKYIKNRAIGMTIIVVLFFCANYLINGLQLALPLGIEESLIAIPFVVLGYLLRNIPLILEKITRWYLVLFYLLVFMLGNWIQIIRDYGPMSMWNGDIHSPILYLTNGISGVFILLYIGLRIKNINWINIIGKNSLYIFGIHYIFLELVCLFAKRIDVSSITGNIATVFLSSFFVLAGSFVIIVIVKRIFRLKL